MNPTMYTKINTHIQTYPFPRHRSTNVTADKDCHFKYFQTIKKRNYSQITLQNAVAGRWKHVKSGGSRLPKKLGLGNKKRRD